MKKIVVIGAGSADFGLTNFGAILRTPELKGSELGLVDINGEGLALITKFAERLNREWGSEFTIKSSTDRRDLLPYADFVILSVAVDREKCWKQEHDIAKKYNIMHYAENGGPGGLIHTARNLTIIMPILRDIEELCPDAWVMNFTNPVPRICIAASRYTKVKMVGICHQIEFGYSILAKVLAKDLGFNVPENYLFRWDKETEDIYGKLVSQAQEKIDLLAAGINHFTWMLSIRDSKDGSDLYPLFRDRYMSGFEDFEPLTREIFDIFKICPVPGDCHMAEYLPYTHNMVRNSWNKYDVQMYPFTDSVINREKMWVEIKAMAEGKKNVDHLRDIHSERAEQIIAAIAFNKHLYDMAVNIPNKGYIENLPQDAIVEVPAVISADGIKGVGVGRLPETVAELCRRQITVAELVVKAGVTGDRDIALQALALDPMVDDPDIARKLLRDYLETQKDYLPQFFGRNEWL